MEFIITLVVQTKMEREYFDCSILLLNMVNCLSRVTSDSIVKKVKINWASSVDSWVNFCKLVLIVGRLPLIMADGNLRSGGRGLVVALGLGEEEPSIDQWRERRGDGMPKVTEG